MPPRFLGGKSKKRGEQFAKHVEDFVHHRLRRATARRIRGVAIHPIFGDIDVEAAEIDRTELIERVINLMKLEYFVGGSTISSHLVQSLKNPTVDQCEIRFLGFLLS